MKRYIFFLLLVSFSFAQFYDIALVRANDTTVIQNLVYDDNSTSYKDNSLENPDVSLRICALNAADLQDKYVALVYADGFDGDYLEVDHAPIQVTSVPISLCVFVPIDINSFEAWYPSIPYVFISDTPDLSGASRWKLSRLRGWFIGNYTLVENRVGAVTTINVTDAIEDTSTSIVPDVDFLVVGLVRDDFTTMDTGITSLGDPITLNADSATAQYRIFINGIGPDMPPYVEIITPEPITYDSGTIPFTYLLIDDDEIDKCWYILDGVTVNMPVCGPAYILNVGQGTHVLTLFANDSSGNIGSDSVTFQVGAAPAPPPGGGPPGVPYQPPIIPPPPFLYFAVIPDDIYVIIDYPEEGTSEFMVTSTIYLEEVTCFVKGDFSEYATVELEDDKIYEDGTIHGNITVSMPPTVILDYNKSMLGLLQCTGKTDPTLVSSSFANVHLIINRPDFEAEDEVIEVMVGEEKEGVIPFFNIGKNTTTINTTVEFIGAYSTLVTVTDITQGVKTNEMGLIGFKVDVPKYFDTGVYRVPFIIYESGRPLGEGNLYINVIGPPAVICYIPDLLWTLLILIIGLLVSIYVFRRKLRERMKKIPLAQRKKDRWKLYRGPLGQAALTMLVFIVVWAIVVMLLAKCA